MSDEPVWVNAANCKLPDNLSQISENMGSTVNRIPLYPQKLPEYDTIAPQERREEIGKIEQLLSQIVHNTEPIQDLLVLAGKSEENQNLIIDILRLMNSKDGNEAEEKYAHACQKISSAKLAGESIKTLIEFATMAWDIWKKTHGIP